MPPFSFSSSSSSPSLLFLLLLLLLRCGGGAAEDAACSGAFRSGQENFVLDAEDAVKEGAVLLSTAHAPSAESCELACCKDPRCNLALLEPRGSGAAEESRVCVLFNCVHRNRFVCRFVNQVGYLSYIRKSVFLQPLAGPPEAGQLKSHSRKGSQPGLRAPTGPPDDQQERSIIKIIHDKHSLNSHT